jgi:hypothetical protein
VDNYATRTLPLWTTHPPPTCPVIIGQNTLPGQREVPIVPAQRAAER